MANYDLNDEQWAAINAPSPTLTHASAGAGKTRCLVSKIRLLLDSGADPTGICALTFTNKAAKEMKERLKPHCPRIDAMQVSTIHSMCVRIIREFHRYTPLKIPFSIFDDSDQLSIIKTIMKSKVISGDPYDTLSAISVAKSEQNEDGLDEDTAEVYKSYQEILLKNNACDFDDLLIYALKCVEQEDCRKHYTDLWRHILVDEFQDTSTIQYKIIMAFYDPAVTKTFFAVGDGNQCVIEGTNIGSVLAQDIKENDLIPVAIGNKQLNKLRVMNTYKKWVENKPVVTITTSKGHSVTVTNEHTIFAEYTQLNWNDPRYFTYLMFKKGLGYRIGTTSIKRNRGKSSPTLGFKQRLGQERADHLWLLFTSTSKSEAKYYEQYYSVKYGLPTWVDYNDTLIQKLFSEIDTETAAKNLLNDLGLFFDLPHHVPKCMNVKRRRNFTVSLCAENRNTALPLHRYAMSGSNMKDAEILKSMGYNARSSKNRRGYRVEGASSSISFITEIAEKINEKLPLNIINNAKFTEQSLQMIPASHALPGMACFVKNKNGIEIDFIIAVEKKSYTGYVYDFNIERVLNYIANNIVVHNSIYGWRGAHPENMKNFLETYKATECQLTYNYRSCSEVIAHANQFLQYGKPMVAKSASTGKVAFTQFFNQDDEASKIAEAAAKMGNLSETAILYRTNARSVKFEQAFAMRGIPYKVTGDLPFYRRRICKDLLGYCKAAANPADIESLARIVNVPKRGFGEARQERLLKEGRSYLEWEALQMPMIKGLLDLLTEIKDKTPKEALNTVIYKTGYRSTLVKESDHSMIETFLNIASEYHTTDELILASTFLEADSGRGVRLMTAHASKGLEFDRVFVVGVEQGLWPHSMSENIEEEERLYFVAISRAKSFLNISYSKNRLYRGQPIAVEPSSLFIKSVRSCQK